MTIQEALSIANFLSDLASKIYDTARAQPDGGAVNLDNLLVKTTTEKETEAGIDQREVQREIAAQSL